MGGKGGSIPAELTVEEPGSKKCKDINAGIRAAQAKESRQPPDAGKGRNMDSPLEPPGEAQPSHALGFSSARSPTALWHTAL